MIINISDSTKMRKARIDEQIKQRIIEEYCDEEEREDESAIELVQKNPLIRLAVKFDTLDFKKQQDLLKFAETHILGNGRSLDVKDLFFMILQKGNRGAWNDIDDFADKLLMK